MADLSFSTPAKRGSQHTSFSLDGVDCDLPAERQNGLQATIQAVTARLPRFFPLQSFVASNPLHGFESLAYEEALTEIADTLSATPTASLAHYRQRVAGGQLPASIFTSAAKGIAGDRTLQLDGKGIPLAAALEARLSGTLAIIPVPAPLRTAAQNQLDALPKAASLPAPEAPAPAPTLAASFLARRAHPFLQPFMVDDPARAEPITPGALLGAALACLPEAASLATASAGSTLSLVARLLQELGVDEAHEQTFLEALSWRLSGWAAYLSWHQQRAGADPYPVLLELIAALLLLEQAARREAPAAASPGPEASTAGSEDRARLLAQLAAWAGMDADALAAATPVACQNAVDALLAADERTLSLALQTATERHYRTQLLAGLLPNWSHDPKPLSASPRPAAQCFFCIDVRSEPMRRAMEASGACETFGYAGFFGLPIAYERLDGKATDQCPVLLAPSVTVREAPAPHLSERARAQLIDRATQKRLAKASRSLNQQHAGAAFGSVDGFGLFSVGALVGDAFRLGKREHRHDDVVPAWAEDRCDDATLEARVAFARNLFTLTGVRERFARLVLLCGHGGQTRNNPHQAAFDCGACGGHDGAPNAQLLALTLNDPSVRAALREDGVAIPEDTLFVAALHVTTTDELRLLGEATIPASHQPDLAELRTMLAEAGRRARAERAPKLGVKDPEREIPLKAIDGAETRPEWGLAGNAAILVARRALSTGVDLGGRCFLHSYRWENDPDGSALAAILGAPVVVTQWINAQYNASTCDNTHFGAGHKATQNLLGCAVMQGDFGDLKLGLSHESVFAEDGTPMHEPQRLLVIVEAPANTVMAALTATPSVHGLLQRGWLMLTVLAPESPVPLHYDRASDALVADANTEEPA